MLNLKDKELFDKKISLINNRVFRELYINSQQSDADEWDIGLVALWNTPIMFYELKKQYPNKKFYYIEFEDLKDLYGVNKEEAIYIKDEEELAEIMYTFKNPKLLINPPYSIGNKIITICKQKNPKAKYSILMPLAQYKKDLYKYIKSIKFVGGDGFDASITNNNCIVTLAENAIQTNNYFEFVLKSFDQRYIEFYKWNIEHYIGLTTENCTKYLPEQLNLDLDFIEGSRCVDGLHKHGYHPKSNSTYKWNVNFIIDKDNWLNNIMRIRHTSKQAKINYSKYAYNYTNDKFNCLESKAMLGLNINGCSGEYFMYIPQIDWDKIHINQKELWDQGLYDEAVLAEMGLKWEGDKIVKA